MTAKDTAAPYAGERADMEDEVRQLIVDLREAAQDGPRLARRYAELLERVVEEYCVEFEKRAEAVLARLESQ